MEYTIEDLTPVKKKVSVTVSQDEGAAAIAATTALYRTNVNLDGFRKGKVPASIIEKRFGKSIYSEATQDLVNLHINQIVGELKVTPLTGIDFDGGELERGSEFKYSISFEILPEFDLPGYEGIDAEQEKAATDTAEVDKVLERIRNNMAELETVNDKRCPKDNEVVSIDFETFDEEGKAIAGLKADNFQITLDGSSALPDFEALVKKIPAGESGEGNITFPEDFLNPEFASRTLLMKIKTYTIKKKILPEFNDEFAQKASGMESLEKLRASIEENYLKNRENLHKAAGQKKLLDKLVKMVDFPLPDSMVESYLNARVQNVRERFERQGKSLESQGKTEEGLRAEFQTEAEDIARSQVFLLRAARKENIEVADQELDMYLYQEAMRSQQDFSQLKKYYMENNLMFALRDRLAADKAMDAIWAKAKIEFIEEQPKEKA